MTAPARSLSRHEQHLGQLEAAATDPTHPNHEASVWTLRRYRERLLQHLGEGESTALSRAVEEYRAIAAEVAQP